MRDTEFSDNLEQLFYETIIDKVLPEFYAACDKLGISNEQLKEVVNEPAVGSLGAVWVNLCDQALSHRIGGMMAAMFNPETDKHGVSIDELADRLNRKKAHS